MANDLTSGRRKVPDFEQWESPETRIRWERGLAIVAGMIGVILVFFLLLALLPLPAADEERPVTGQGQAQAQAQAQPRAAADAGLQATATPPPATATAAAEPKLNGTSRAAPNVRRGPSLEGAIVTQLRLGQKVDVVGRSTDGQWLQIVGPDNPRDRFWVSADMLDLTGDPRTLPEVRQ